MVKPPFFMLEASKIGSSIEKKIRVILNIIHYSMIFSHLFSHLFNGYSYGIISLFGKICAFSSRRLGWAAASLYPAVFLVQASNKLLGEHWTKCRKGISMAGEHWDQTDQTLPNWDQIWIQTAQKYGKMQIWAYIGMQTNNVFGLTQQKQGNPARKLRVSPAKTGRSQDILGRTSADASFKTSSVLNIHFQVTSFWPMPVKIQRF